MNIRLKNKSIDELTYLHDDVECVIHEKVDDEYCKNITCKVLWLEDYTIEGAAINDKMSHEVKQQEVVPGLY